MDRTTTPVPVIGGKVVVLNGFPDTGKLTILSKLKEHLPADRTRLLDNHLLIDPVAAVIPSRTDEHHELRRQVRAPIFETLRKHVREGHVILMTACLAEDSDRDTAFLKEQMNIVRGTSLPIFWINAHCDQASLEERLESSERREGGKSKLTEVCALRDLRLIKPSKNADESTRLVMGYLDMSGPVEVSVSRLISTITGT